MIIIFMKAVIFHHTCNHGNYQKANWHAHSKTENVDKWEGLILQNVSEGDFDVTTDHKIKKCLHYFKDCFCSCHISTTYRYPIWMPTLYVSDFERLTKHNIIFNDTICSLSHVSWSIMRRFNERYFVLIFAVSTLYSYLISLSTGHIIWEGFYAIHVALVLNNPWKVNRVDNLQIDF